MRFLKFIFSRFFICITVIAALIAAIIFLCVYINSLLPAAVAVVFSFTLSVIAALCLLTGESPTEFKCGWLALIAILPASGAILYFLSYLSKTQKLGRSEILPAAGCCGYEYFSDGAEYLDRLILLISSAKKRVYLEYYIISKGHIWGAVCRELEKALARGVEVKIIYDGLGSAFKAPKKDFKRLVKAGAAVKAFNNPLPFPISRLNFRDHRKIAAIDGEAVFLGGVNVADEYAHLTSPHGYWKDGGALFYGRIARVFENVFLTAFDGKERTTGSAVGAVCEDGDKFELVPVIDQPEKRGGVCEDLLASAISAAKERVYIFTPYLCAGEKLSDALTFAARRGVDVKLLIPHIPDKKLPYAITRTYCERFSDDGVQIFEYTPGFMHFKGAVCDDSAILGSYNFDYRSMRLNHECAVSGGAELSDDMARDFENCLAVSAPFKRGKKNFATQFFRRIICLFAPLV